MRRVEIGITVEPIQIAGVDEELGRILFNSDLRRNLRQGDGDSRSAIHDGVLSTQNDFAGRFGGDGHFKK
jgi:hypothetical protein